MKTRFVLQAGLKKFPVIGKAFTGDDKTQVILAFRCEGKKNINRWKGEYLMATPHVEKFMDALREIEESSETKGMLDLFSEKCEISNVAIKPLRGKQGVLRFWRDYRANFKEIHTEFTSVTETEGKSFLEWVSRGVLQSGRCIIYEGLTFLEWADSQIVRFKAYHDSAAFLKEGGKHQEASTVNPEGMISTEEVMRGGPRRDISTPGEGVLTSTPTDRDASTD